MESESIARALMRHIMVTFEPCMAIPEDTYPAFWIGIIRDAVQNMIDWNPNFEFTEDIIEEIAITGDEEEVIRKYNKLAGFSILYFVLDKYFDNDYDEIETRNKRGL